MLRKLILISIVSVNVGYTVFLFLLLGMIYPDMVPLTVYNWLAFMFVDTVWGLILGIVIYLVVRVSGVDLVKATALSITAIWIAFWLFSLLLTNGYSTISMYAIVVLCIDGVAALMVWVVFVVLTKYCALS